MYIRKSNKHQVNQTKDYWPLQQSYLKQHTVQGDLHSCCNLYVYEAERWVGVWFNHERAHTAYVTAMIVVFWVMIQSEEFSTAKNPDNTSMKAPIRYANVVTDTGAGYVFKIGLWLQHCSHSVMNTYNNACFATTPAASTHQICFLSEMVAVQRDKLQQIPRKTYGVWQESDKENWSKIWMNTDGHHWYEDFHLEVDIDAHAGRLLNTVLHIALSPFQALVQAGELLRYEYQQVMLRLGESIGSTKKCWPFVKGHDHCPCHTCHNSQNLGLAISSGIMYNLYPVGRYMHHGYVNEMDALFIEEQEQQK